MSAAPSARSTLLPILWLTLTSSWLALIVAIDQPGWSLASGLVSIIGPAVGRPN